MSNGKIVETRYIFLDGRKCYMFGFRIADELKKGEIRGNESRPINFQDPYERLHVPYFQYTQTLQHFHERSFLGGEQCSNRAKNEV